MSIVESFPLSVDKVYRQYTKLPADAKDTFYHYTTREGLEGILRSGGLWAKYRGEMSDEGEFSYAKKMFYRAIKEISEAPNQPKVSRSFTKYMILNLDKFLVTTPEKCNSYCACLTVESDNQNQWEQYAEGGKGVALGVNLNKILNSQMNNVPNGKPFLISSTVIYDEMEQLNIPRQFVNAAISDLVRFSDSVSNQPIYLTALRDRIAPFIYSQLLILINFIKNPRYSNEREIRLMFDPNDGTETVDSIQCYTRGNESIPFIFLDLRNPITNLLPLVDIKIGPKASFESDCRFLKSLLTELGYRRNNQDMPRISHSRFEDE